jgi:hypothetical protein
VRECSGTVGCPYRLVWRLHLPAASDAPSANSFKWLYVYVRQARNNKKVDYPPSSGSSTPVRTYKTWARTVTWKQTSRWLPSCGGSPALDPT